MVVEKVLLYSLLLYLLNLRRFWPNKCSNTYSDSAVQIQNNMFQEGARYLLKGNYGGAEPWPHMRYQKLTVTKLIGFVALEKRTSNDKSLQQDTRNI